MGKQLFTHGKNTLFLQLLSSRNCERAVPIICARVADYDGTQLFASDLETNLLQNSSRKSMTRQHR